MVIVVFMIVVLFIIYYMYSFLEVLVFKIQRWYIILSLLVQRDLEDAL